MDACAHLLVLAALPPWAGKTPPRLIDATLGGGGHSAPLLKDHPRLELIGLDQDATARAAAAEWLAHWADRPAPGG
jgi:16S rRNA (cytosine1402-N4)-methyltransferase